MKEKLRKLLDSGNLEDIFIMVRYLYSKGFSLITNAGYDALVKHFKEEKPDWEYLARTYDDDPIPYEVASKYGIRLKSPNNPPASDKIQQLMDEEQSKSIQPLENYEEAWEWFKDKSGVELAFSTKVDGINTKNLYQRIGDSHTYRYLASRTRGRTGSSIDITHNVKRRLPQEITLEHNDQEYVWVRGEGFAAPDKLP